MQTKNDQQLDRRRLLTGAAWAGGAAALALTQTSCTTSTTEAGAPAGAILVVSDHNAVVDTGAGKVRGFTRNGIHTFKGIPYAASTEGQGRFLPPSKPKPWTGIRSAMYYGPTCPQAARTGWLNDENAFLF